MTTRRQLIKTSLSLAAVPIGMSVAIEVAHAEDMPQWDKETDVLVLGYGNAGSNAAIAAADAGAKVLILEKTAATEQLDKSSVGLLPKREEIHSLG
jgi:heterodisulfide reductase subunit A-like polyferredoxin